jgi:quercetin dioxygenase-like cupin family protein
MIDEMSEERPVRPIAQNVKRWVVVFCAILAPLLTGSLVAGTAFATPGSGVTQRTVATGVLPEPVRMKLAQRNPHMPDEHSRPIALSLNESTIDTAGDREGFGDGVDVSSITIVTNTIAPGGYFGWHQHSGPSWIVMTRGTLTFYNADDPTCTGHPVSAGSVFLDMGNHTHNARNETNEPAENYVVRMLPEGGVPRIDMPNPGVCPGLP